MSRKKSQWGRASVCGAMLLCCSALAPTVAALDYGGARLSLRVDGDFVSANIRAMPLAEVARALEMQTDVAIHLRSSKLKDQEITARFENLNLEAALRDILKDTSYAMAPGPTERGVGIQVYVYSRLSGSASGHGLTTSETGADEKASYRQSQLAETRPKDATEIPVPPEAHPDPAVRVLDLEDAVATYGPQSLPLVLAGVQDPDPAVRAASEELLLNDLHDAVPRATLSKMALTSQRADIRMRALEALAERRDELRYVRMTLDSARRDSDPEVQQRAEDLLLELSDRQSD